MATIGMVAVAALAANAEGSPPTVASTATCRCTSSVASAGSRPYSPLAQRYSIAKFFPSIAPASAKPCRNAAARATLSSGERVLRNPTTRTAGCSARTVIGHNAATLSPAMMSRRRMLPSALFDYLISLSQHHFCSTSTPGAFALGSAPIRPDRNNGSPLAYNRFPI